MQEILDSIFADMDNLCVEVEHFDEHSTITFEEGLVLGLEVFDELHAYKIVVTEARAWMSQGAGICKLTVKQR